MAAVLFERGSSQAELENGVQKAPEKSQGRTMGKRKRIAKMTQGCFCWTVGPVGAG